MRIFLYLPDPPHSFIIDTKQFFRSKVMEYMDYHLPAGTCLDGRYTIKKVIGEGGFGITYEAVNIALGSRVAIKEFYYRECVTRDSAVSTQICFSSPDRQELYRKARERFLREARTVSDFSDAPGIISVLDYFEANETAYIVMKYLDGITLQQYLKEHGSFPAEQICAMLLPVLRSLEKIHASGIIHRDISPDNIMVLSDGSLCLIDFGAARLYLKDAQKSSAIITKNGYTPCEQYDASMPQGPWSDIYSLSAVLYACITGKIPESSLQRLLLDTLKLPSELGISISPEIEAVLRKGLSLQPEKRFASLSEYISQLKKCLPREDEALLKAKRRKRLLMATGCFLVFFAAAFFAFYRTHVELFKFYGEDTVDFLLYPDDTMTTAEYYEARDIVENRLKTLAGGDDYILEEKSGYLRGVIALSDCGSLNLRELFRTYITRPVQPSLDGDALSSEDLISPEITVGEDTAWLTFGLSDACMQKLTSEPTSHYLFLDYSYSDPFFREIEITEDGLCRIEIPREGSLPTLMLQNLTSDHPAKGLYLQYEPDVAWEDSATSLISGEKQVNAENITKPSLICELKPSTAPDRGTWFHVISDFKTRLDSLGIPYAFGTDTHGESHVILKMAQEDYCDTLLQVLTAPDAYLLLSIGSTEIYLDQTDMNMEETGDGTYRLNVQITSSYYLEKLKKALDSLASGGTATVYLRCRDIILANGEVTAAAAKGQISLDSYGAQKQPITDTELPLLRLACSCAGDTTMPVVYTLYSQNLLSDQEGIQTPVTCRQEWNPNQSHEDQVLEALHSNLPEIVSAEFSLDAAHYQLIITLPDTVGELSASRRRELFTAIISICTDDIGQIPAICIQQQKKGSPGLVDAKAWLNYMSSQQTYQFSFSAFTEEAMTAYTQLKEDLENDAQLKNRLYIYQK